MAEAADAEGGVVKEFLLATLLGGDGVELGTCCIPDGMGIDGDMFIDGGQV